MFKIRDVKLNDYLPQVVGDAKEIKEMNRVEDFEFGILWGKAEKLYFNRWILSADDDGIKRYEKLLGLKPVGDLEERRKKVFYEWNKQVKYTDRSLRKMMADLLGEDGFSMVINYSKYTVDFEVVVNKELNGYEIYKELREIIPANMGIHFSYGLYEDIILETRYGKATFTKVLCKEKLCGCNPHDTKVGHAINIGICLETEYDGSRNYYALPGGLKAGEINSEKKTFTGEVIYQSEFSSEDIYKFTEE